LTLLIQNPPSKSSKPFITQITKESSWVIYPVALITVRPSSGKKNKKKLDFTPKIPLFWDTVGKSGEKYQIRILNMFKGQFLYSIDSKSRISIPAKLRKNLLPEAKDSFVLTQGIGKCIDVYPADYWETIEKRLNQLNQYDPNEMKFIRMFLQHATDVEMDNQARVILPPYLLEFAGIEKEVLILGALQKIEIWNPQTFKDHSAGSPESYDQLAAKVMMGR